MGLDMYLYANKYVSYWLSRDEDKAKQIARINAIREAAGFPKDTNERPEGVTVQVQAGYWRKANAIHKWFVENCQDGVDDCRESYVSREQLQELLGICQKVMKASKTAKGVVRNGMVASAKTGGKLAHNLEVGTVVVNKEVAQELLPPEDGFFFGSTDIDGYYLEDVALTIRILKNALKAKGPFADCDFAYRSSW